MTLQAQTPLISIVFPTWNCAELLREAVASVAKQTYTNWELVIINNFSTDHTKDVVASFGDDRIKIFDFHNQGIIAAARNVGIERSSGEYVAFLDSDDFWYPRKLETCLAVLLEHGVGLVCHGERHFKDLPDGSRLEWDVVNGKDSDLSLNSLLYRGNFLSTSAVLVEAKILKNLNGFQTESMFNTAEDYELWLRIMESGATVRIIPDILGAYRIHSASASASLLRHVKAVREVVIKHHQILKDRGQGSVPGFNYRMGRMALSSARALYKAGDFRNGLSYLLESGLLSLRGRG